MRWFARFTVGWLALIVILAALAIWIPREPPAPSLLAYVTHSYATGSDIAVVWPDTPRHRPLTGSRANGHIPGNPIWSPDRQWIAFVASDGPASDIYLMALDGSALHNLTDSPARDRDPAWSPDGRWIAFRSDRAGSEDIYLVRPDGSDLRAITHHPAADFAPVWSPDGSQIAFVSSRAGDRGLFVVQFDGSDLRQIAGDGAYGPAWSPDGTWIAYLSARDLLAADLRVVRADGTATYRLSDGMTTAGSPAWSPDSAWLAFWATLPGQEPDVFVIRPTQTDLRRLTDHAATDRAPAWSPDGRWIAFESTRDGNREIYVMRPDGSGAINLSRNAGDDSAPVWSPPAARPYQPGYLLALALIGAGVALWRQLLWGRDRIARVLRGKWSSARPLPARAPDAPAHEVR